MLWFSGKVGPFPSCWGLRPAARGPGRSCDSETPQHPWEQRPQLCFLGAGGPSLGCAGAPGCRPAQQESWCTRSFPGCELGAHALSSMSERWPGSGGGQEATGGRASRVARASQSLHPRTSGRSFRLKGTDQGQADSRLTDQVENHFGSKVRHSAFQPPPLWLQPGNWLRSNVSERVLVKLDGPRQAECWLWPLGCGSPAPHLSQWVMLFSMGERSRGNGAKFFFCLDSLSVRNTRSWHFKLPFLVNMTRHNLISFWLAIPTGAGQEATTGPKRPRRGILGVISSQCDEVRACDFERKGTCWAVSAASTAVLGRQGALCSSLSGSPDVHRARRPAHEWREQGLAQPPH